MGEIVGFPGGKPLEDYDVKEPFTMPKTKEERVAKLLKMELPEIQRESGDNVESLVINRSIREWVAPALDQEVSEETPQPPPAKVQLERIRQAKADGKFKD